MFLVSLILPMIFGVVCWGITGGVETENVDNYLSLSGLVLSGLALLAIPVSYLLSWDWRSYYYGASIFGIASVACLGIYPLLYIVIYSSLPLAVRIALVCVEALIVILWCARFVRVYERIYKNKSLFEKIYVEESDIVYFLIQMDKRVLEHELRFAQFPGGKYFALTFVFGSCVFLFGNEITEFLGIPFTHVFWALIFAVFPASFFGAATKIWLVCYQYPRRIKKLTGKSTYVDLVSKMKRVLH